MYRPNMKTIVVIATLAVLGIVLSGCLRSGKQDTRTLTLAINSGVEGDALKQAAKDYEAQTGVHVQIAEARFITLQPPALSKKGTRLLSSPNVNRLQRLSRSSASFSTVA